MTILRKFTVEGECGHKFNVVLKKSLHYYLNSSYLKELLSGDICYSKCPYCEKKVVFYFGFVVETLDEKIKIFPLKWKLKILEKENEKKSENIIILFEEYGKEFKNLEKHLKERRFINEKGELPEAYSPQELKDYMSVELGTWRPKTFMKKNGKLIKLRKKW